MCTINDNHMMYGSWDIECNGQNFLSFWTIFCPFTLPPLTTWKIKILKILKNKQTNKQNVWRHYNFRHVYQKWQLWCMAPEYGVPWTVFFCHFGLFLPFYPLSNPENQNFEENEKIPANMIILHMYTINDNHMMYGSWDMEYNGQKFLSFWTINHPFNPLTTQVIKILKKWNNMPGNIIILHTCTINDDHTMYSSWGMECNR